MQKLGSALTAMAALMLGLGLASAAKATPLYVDTPPYPDISLTFVSISYSSSAETLSASDPFMGSFMLDATNQPSITAPDLDLLAAIDNDGVLSSGSIVVSGTVGAPLNYITGTLLTGNLIAFGFPDNIVTQPNILEFRFTVTGGEAADLYGGTAYIVLTGTGFTGSFNSNFSSGLGGGPVDIRLIPEPSTAVLVGLGFLGLLGAARRAKAGR